ncbi:UDP-N-acetylglucosamine 4,6-dehydratase (inverting) [Candidatus Pelagibacter sp.]|uniref:UDP-N-acetylglucosamine 4,6-dehydratase (inverting) n=1 Tax=Candidatus Pelagibacter sp. TaxID=2024849 RepID=UPI003F8487B7
MFNNKTIFISGGTGSFGKEFCKYLVKKYVPKKIIVFSRDELKQKEMSDDLMYNERKIFRFFIGDVRDKERLIMAMQNVDFVVHAAALKQVDTAEYNPFEFIKTNINGGNNIVESALINNVKKVIALSTDKAAQSTNLYGATKLVSDKLFISANNFKGKNKTTFSVVRYGNVADSRGSVLPLFRKLLKDKKKLTLTDPRMTRFWITLDESVKFVVNCFKIMEGGEIFIPKLKSFKITDLIKAIDEKAKVKTIGIRPGEKLHEVMCPNEEVQNTLEFKNFFVIYQSIDKFLEKNFYQINLKNKKGRKVSKNFEYNSQNNKEFFSVKQLKVELKKLKKSS